MRPRPGAQGRRRRGQCQTPGGARGRCWSVGQGSAQGPCRRNTTRRTPTHLHRPSRVSDLIRCGRPIRHAALLTSTTTTTTTLPAPPRLPPPPYQHTPLSMAHTPRQHSSWRLLALSVALAATAFTVGSVSAVHAPSFERRTAHSDATSVAHGISGNGHKFDGKTFDYGASQCSSNPCRRLHFWPALMGFSRHRQQLEASVSLLLGAERLTCF